MSSVKRAGLLAEGAAYSPFEAASFSETRSAELMSAVAEPQESMARRGPNSLHLADAFRKAASCLPKAPACLPKGISQLTASFGASSP